MFFHDSRTAGYKSAGSSRNRLRSLHGFDRPSEMRLKPVTHRVNRCRLYGTRCGNGHVVRNVELIAILHYLLKLFSRFYNTRPRLKFRRKFFSAFFVYHGMISC